MNAITIVGAGPAGLKTAIELANNGWQATVIEEHAEIGKPVNCGGLISESGVTSVGLDIRNCIVNQVRGARIFAPNNEMIEVKRDKRVAFVIDRAEFDKTLYRRATVEKGVEVRTETKLIDIRKETLFLESKGHGELLKSKIVVGADGPNSKVRELMGITTSQKDFVHSFQAKAKGSFDRDFVEMYFGDFAKGFFAWVIPESNTIARIGIGCSMGLNPLNAFQKFVEAKQLHFEVLEQNSALIPVGKPLKNAATKDRLLVGDSAFSTKSTTGGGIITGCIAAKAAAETISEHLKNGKPLSDYHKNLYELEKELLTHWRIRNYLNSLSEQKINSLFLKLKKAKIEDFLAQYGDMDKPSKFAGKLLAKPSMWFLLPEALRILR